MRPEFVVCGLGNPGEKYVFTRHNAGFLTLDMLSQKLGGVRINSLKFHALCGDAVIAGVPVLLMKPQTFMNSSGLAAAAALSYFKLPPERLVVIHDDINFEPGRLRIRLKGSAGGHNGIESVIEETHSSAFPRIKLGVGQKPPEWDLADWVLSKVPAEDQKPLFSAMESACEALPLLLTGDGEKAMSRFNSAG
ncbi:MAG: aminoacyl-tRNA hydrolase [Clostridia bacterium]|nr:aminoacyl-tRNA hydrolase [Clostridia bacterium]